MKSFVFFLMILCIAAMGLGPTANAADKTILVIESYHVEYPWDASYLKGLRDTLGSGYNVINFEMDTKRVPASEYGARADMAWNKYLEIKPDLVVLGDDNALKLLTPRFAGIKTPVVYLGINNNPRAYGAYGVANITGVLERPIMKRGVAFLKDILSQKPSKVLVMFDSGTTSKASVTEAFAGQTRLDVSGVQVDLELIDTMAKWEQTILSAKTNGYDAIFVGLYHTIVDENGKNVDANKVLQWTSEKTSVPIFCFWDFAVGSDKTIGGYVLYGQVQGEMAGDMVKQIFAGASPASITEQTARQGQFLYSKTQLKKWNITLPAKIAGEARYTD